jgi:surfactin synthase thioesterase subunit
MSDGSANNAWLRPWREAARRPTLVCLPDCGSGASLFDPWRSALPSRIAVRAVQLPGREERWSETPRVALDDVVGAVATAVSQIEPGPILLFGHFLGAILAFELARELGRRSLPVAGLLVSACRAPHLPDPFPPIRHVPTPALARELADRYDASPVLIDEPELMDVLAPAICGDLALYETYRMVPGASLECPIVVYGGSEDVSVTRCELEEWRMHTTGKYRLQTYYGTHRFLRSVPSPLFDLVQTDVAALCDNLAGWSTRLETELAAIWQGLLGVDSVGTHDNFFAELGGNSLLATRLISHVRARYGIALPLKAFFDDPTLEGMCSALTDASVDTSEQDRSAQSREILRGRPTRAVLRSTGDLTVET